MEKKEKYQIALLIISSIILWTVFAYLFMTTTTPYPDKMFGLAPAGLMQAVIAYAIGTW